MDQFLKGRPCTTLRIWALHDRVRTRHLGRGRGPLKSYVFEGPDSYGVIPFFANEHFGEGASKHKKKQGRPTPNMFV